ncbi:right-handed parallel beta-helix repeat-containing protein [Flammeovirga aprica]|uniref:T9SS type A sorting domain-containing protein n=1 Tax=Flammeovirga aprica JL-4 TaxID=694437 RepID=A0A7X9RXZ3_9BACT|nr:right-handed parallel beta-helix repeat-containing protein [Flammeovirga aprica]NME70791.1 T9SS type A sorting domain-containing protein [Flammeovirga aprica JL-4]
MKTQLFALLLWACFCGFVSAKEIHVAKNGNDTNAGTSSNPYLTIQKAANVAVAGDVVIIHQGTYRETVETKNNGTSSNPITYRAASGETVIVSATQEINNWTLTTNNIYKANVTMPLGMEHNALFYDGDQMDIARWPNNADNDPYTPDAKYITGGSGSHITYSGIPTYDWSEGYMWYLGGHSGASFTRKITAATSSRVDFEGVDITKWPFSVHNPTVTRNGHKGIFFLFNSLGALDIQREYFYDASAKVIYFKAPNNVNPTSGKCEFRARQYTFKVSKNYIVLDGIETFGGIVLITGNNNTVKNSTIRHGVPILDELTNTDAQIGSGAITIEGSNTLIEKNLIEKGTANGISMLAAWKGSQNATIKNNVVRNFNTLGIHAEPIRSNCPGTVIENNTVYGGGRSGIYVSGSNATVAYNNVYDVMKINADGGVFYTVGNADYKNSVIHHNWFHNSTAAPHAGYKVAGIYLDNNSKGYQVYNNVVYNVSWTGIQINWDNWGLDFYNNSIYNASEGMGRWENGYTMDDVVLINNYASTAPWYGTDIQPQNIINANNPFVDPANLNFEPKSGSYLVDAGKVIPGFTDGYKGSAPDIGAYERGGVMWVPGADWTPSNDLPSSTTVSIVSAPQTVATGDSFNVQVGYTATAQYEIVVLVNDPSGVWLTSSKQTVSAGEGTKTLTVSQPSNWTVENNYKLGVSIRPVGGDFNSNLDYVSSNFNVTTALVQYSFENQGSFNYMSASNPNVMNTSGTIGNTELFEIIDNGDGTVSFKGSNGLYVSSENGNKEMTCIRTEIGAWEKFEMVDYGNDIYALKGNNLLFVRDNMLCTSTGASNWQKFKIVPSSSSSRQRNLEDDIAEELDFVVYPNPSSGTFNIKRNQILENTRITIFSTLGQMVYDQNASSDIENIDLKGLGNGVYIIKMTSDNITKTKQIIIQ